MLSATKIGSPDGIDALLDMRGFEALFEERHAYCRGRFLLSAPADSLCLPASDFAEADHLAEMLEDYRERFPGVDVRSAVSLWTMYYFSGLVTSPAIAWLKDRRVLPLHLATTSVVLDQATWMPSAFVIPNYGERVEKLTIFEAFDGPIRRHAEPVVEALAEAAGLSRKLLWSNLVVYLDWILRDLADVIGPEGLAEGLGLVERETWPDGWRNPLYKLLRRQDDGCGCEISRRRVCCLRYLVPGVPGCGMVCPIPEGRQ